MTFTRNTVAKGAGALTIQKIDDARILFLNTNSKYAFTKTETEGDKVQGMNSSGSLVDLDVAGSEITFELEVSSKKNTRNINELVLNSAYITKSSYNTPWAETATITGGSVTLVNGTPVASSVAVTDLDTGRVYTSTAGTPTAGQFKDNGDGTISFHSSDNGKVVAILYKFALSNVYVQGGADYAALGYVNVFFHQISGSSSDSTKKGVDVLWLPKCSISGEATFEFSNEVQEKTFKLTGLIPDTPVGFLVPYAWIRDAEAKNTNAG